METKSQLQLPPHLQAGKQKAAGQHKLWPPYGEPGQPGEEYLARGPQPAEPASTGNDRGSGGSASTGIDSIELEVIRQCRIESPEDTAQTVFPPTGFHGPPYETYVRILRTGVLIDPCSFYGNLGKHGMTATAEEMEKITNAYFDHVTRHCSPVYKNAVPAACRAGRDGRQNGGRKSAATQSKDDHLPLWQRRMTQFMTQCLTGEAGSIPGQSPRGPTNMQHEDPEEQKFANKHPTRSEHGHPEVTKSMHGRDAKFPPDPNPRTGFRYYYPSKKASGKEARIYCGWKLAEDRFLPGVNWQHSEVRGFASLDDAHQFFYGQHGHAYTVTTEK